MLKNKTYWYKWIILFFCSGMFGVQVMAQSSSFSVEIDVEPSLIDAQLNGHHAIRANAYLSNLSDALGNLERIPNDRILEARYIFSF